MRTINHYKNDKFTVKLIFNFFINNTLWIYTNHYKQKSIKNIDSNQILKPVLLVDYGDIHMDMVFFLEDPTPGCSWGHNLEFCANSVSAQLLVVVDGASEGTTTVLDMDKKALAYMWSCPAIFYWSLSIGAFSSLFFVEFSVILA